MKNIPNPSEKKLDKIWNDLNIDLIKRFIKNKNYKGILSYVREVGLKGEPIARVYIYERFEDKDDNIVNFIKQVTKKNGETISTAFGVQIEYPDGKEEIRLFKDQESAMKYYRQWESDGGDPGDPGNPGGSGGIPVGSSPSPILSMDRKKKH